VERHPRKGYDDRLGRGHEAEGALQQCTGCAWRLRALKADLRRSSGPMFAWDSAGGRDEMLHGYMINYDAGKIIQSPGRGPEPPRRNVSDVVEHPDLFRFTLALPHARAPRPVEREAGPMARGIIGPEGSQSAETEEWISLAFPRTAQDSHGAGPTHDGDDQERAQQVHQVNVAPAHRHEPCRHLRFFLPAHRLP